MYFYVAVPSGHLMPHLSRQEGFGPRSLTKLSASQSLIREIVPTLFAGHLLAYWLYKATAVEIDENRAKQAETSGGEPITEGLLKKP